MEDYRGEFPIFENNKDLVYLDSAATTQKPREVLDAVYRYNIYSNANPGRGSYSLGVMAESEVERVRARVKEFLHAVEGEEVIFVKSATEGINHLVNSFERMGFEEGDEVLVGISSHHSNIVPWQELVKRTNGRLKYFHIDSDGRLDREEIEEKVSERTKIVTFSHGVNATGIIHDPHLVTEVVRRKSDAYVILDVAQTIGEGLVDVNEIDADAFVFSGHKMFSPMGIGGVVLSKELLEKLPPFLYGGDMIEFVEEESSTYREGYEKFEGGTHNVEGIVGLGAAMDFMERIGVERIREQKVELHDYAVKKLRDKCWIDLYHTSGNKAGVLAFNVKGVHPHDVSQILDLENVCIRTGHHCAQPLMKHLGIPSCCRISFSIYNTKKDIDKLAVALQKVADLFLGRDTDGVR